MRKKSVVRENIEAIVIAIVLALIIRTFVVQAFKIPSGSMETTLLVGDHILVNKFMYGVRIPYTDVKFFDFREPKRGEVIVFIYPKDESKDYIKRVRSNKDKRAYNLVLTSEGLETVSTLWDALVASENEIIKSLSQKDQFCFRKFVKCLYDENM